MRNKSQFLNIEQLVSDSLISSCYRCASPRHIFFFEFYSDLKQTTFNKRRVIRKNIPFELFPVLTQGFFKKKAFTCEKNQTFSYVGFSVTVVFFKVACHKFILRDYGLPLYQAIFSNIRHLRTLDEQGFFFENIVGKEEHAGNHHFQKKISFFFVTLLSSAHICNLDVSKFFYRLVKSKT